MKTIDLGNLSKNQLEQFQRFESSGSEHHFIQDSLLFQAKEKINQIQNGCQKLFYSTRFIEDSISCIKPGEKVYVWGNDKRAETIAAQLSIKGCRVILDRLDGERRKYVKTEEQETDPRIKLLEAPDPVDPAASKKPRLRDAKIEDLIGIERIGTTLAQRIIDTAQEATSWAVFSKLRGMGPLKISKLKSIYRI